MSAGREGGGTLTFLACGDELISLSALAPRSRRLGIERGRDGLRLVLGASRGGHGGGGSGTRGARAHATWGAEALNGGPEHDS